MEENQNPYESQSVSAKTLIKESIFGFTLVTVVLTFILALALIAAAVYNVSLWQNGARPPRELALKLLRTQGILVMLLGLSMPIHLIATIILAVNRKSRKAVIAFIGFVSATLAILFTMFYDQGSIFLQ